MFPVVRLGVHKIHQTLAHTSMRKRSVKTMTRGKTKIVKPKYKYNYHPLNVNIVRKYNQVTMHVNNGQLCLECGTDFEELGHFP